MSKSEYSLNKLTLNSALSILTLYGIVVPFGANLVYILFSILLHPGKNPSYDGVIEGLGLALGCYAALRMDGKVSNPIRIVAAIVLSAWSIFVLMFCAQIIFDY